MRATSSHSFTSLALKLVGLIFVVASLVDYIVLLTPFNIQDRGWQLNITTQMVEQGIVPLVGIVFLLLGYWLDANADVPAEGKSWQDLRFWALLFSSLLGLLFLLLVPLHLNNIGFARNQALQQIGDRANQLEGQVNVQLQQLSAVLNNDQALTQLEQVIKSGQYQGQKLQEPQLAQLRQQREQLLKLKQNPNALNEESKQALTKIRSEKLKLEQGAQREAVKSVVRTGLKSLLLAIAFSAIGWTGLRGILGGGGGRRKASLR